VAANNVLGKKKAVRRLTPAQAKLAAKAMQKKGPAPLMKAPASAKFTPPGFDAEDKIDKGVDEAKEKS
jgi:hypothetical protein